MRRGLRDEAKFDFAVLKRQAKKKQEQAREKANADLSHYGQLLSFKDPDDQLESKKFLLRHLPVSRPPTELRDRKDSSTHRKMPSIEDLSSKFRAWESEIHQRTTYIQPQTTSDATPMEFPKIGNTNPLPVPQSSGAKPMSLVRSSSPAASEVQRFDGVLRVGQAELAALSSQLPPAATASDAQSPPLARDEAALSGLLRGTLLQLRGISELAAAEGLYTPSAAPVSTPTGAPAAHSAESAAAPLPQRSPSLHGQPPQAPSAAPPSGRPGPEGLASLMRRFHAWERAHKKEAGGPAAPAAPRAGESESAGEAFRRALASTAAVLLPPPPPPNAQRPQLSLSRRLPPPASPVAAAPPAGAVCARLTRRLAGHPATLEGECSRAAGCAFDFGRQACLPAR